MKVSDIEGTKAAAEDSIISLKVLDIVAGLPVAPCITVAVVDSIQSFLCVAAFSVHVDGVGPSPSSTSSSTSSSSSPPSMTFTLPQKPKMMKTFYRRTLPSTAISFSSREGKAIFASAMASGGTNSFFSLIEQL